MFVSEYRDYFVRVFPTASRLERLTIIAEVSAIVGWRLALAANGYVVEVLMLTVLANVVGLSLLGYLFAWLVHTPFVETERYRDTATLLLPGPVHRLLTRLWLWQNYHSIHHLFPRVPFYRYSALFDEIRPGMEERGAPIVQLGSGSAGRDSVAGANLPS